VILATGDLAPDRPDPRTCFAATLDTLRSAEVVFGQLETTFAETGKRLPQARHAVLAQPECAGALADAGFGVISCAGNHCLDWGSEALLATIKNLNAAGIDVVGAGRDIAAARKPAIRVLADGTRVAFLAYCSILPSAYWANECRPGCAPMRAHTLYEQIETDQPGTPARTRTFAFPEDLETMRADIRAAKMRADVVLVSQHWGIHFVRAMIADYQREVARAAVEAGADAVLGHHPHILKGVEIIDDKPVLYSLCNFAADLRMDAEHASRASFKEIQALARDWVPDFDSRYNFPLESRLSCIARLEVSDGALRETSLLPLYIGRDAVPHLQRHEDPHFLEVARYLSEVTQEAGLNARLPVEGDRILVRPA
jgi:poly-gamma-glutamate capsule biosynthesis protein CapA/YwtB (metallophosphatase superfamily)